jgi:squalene cyclase
LEPLEDYRIFEAVNVIFSLQNTDGGWATYENKRGPNFLELLNPSEVFYDIIVDYSNIDELFAASNSFL